MAKVPLTPAAQAELAEMMLTIGRGKHRKTVLKALKDEMPGYELPDDVRTSDAVETIDEKFAERDRKAAEKEAKDKLERQRKGLIDGSLIEGRQYTEEQVKEIEALMEQRGVADYESGALIYAGSQKPVAATPEIPSRGNWTFPKVDNPFNSAKLALDAKDTAYKVIDELNSRRRA